ncbi:MAG: glutamine-hydrolyzing carbamoyl-phosphate synthase small subunit [Gammaproteobacteria bacterium]|nr:glutamine-hydrolyzing carbamoyl-phosphate synthase small subunit [Gammaproteobacteria bacterium]
MTTPALLALDDGTLFHGVSVGVDGQTTGEVVFNTAMTGYQEILTDPSYAKQLVTLTYPHIGNTGTTPDDHEADAAHASGLIIRDLPRLHSNWRSNASLSEWLRQQGVVAIADIDTRALTRHLRTQGACGGCIVSGDNIDADAAVQQAREFPGLSGMDLAQVVSCTSSYRWNQTVWDLQSDSAVADASANEKTGSNPRFHVVAMDFGVKANILRLLVDRGCSVTVVPAQTSCEDILALAPDGVFLSNGPGDPEPCDYAINAIRALMKQRMPLFGICLGHQLLALASGASTLKMKFGHHGANHPVQELASGRVMISSQNHGFAVDSESLGDTLEATHVSLFDGSLQGIRHKSVPAFSFQGHPEASPGPHDVAGLFDQFIDLMVEHPASSTS